MKFYYVVTEIKINFFHVNFEPNEILTTDNNYAMLSLKIYIKTPL